MVTVVFSPVLRNFQPGEFSQGSEMDYQPGKPQARMTVVEKGLLLNPGQGCPAGDVVRRSLQPRVPSSSSLPSCVGCTSSKAQRCHEKEKGSGVPARVLREGNEEQEQSQPCWNP